MLVNACFPLAIEALERCVGVEGSARRAPGIDGGGPILVAKGHARIYHQIVGKPQENAHYTVKRDTGLLRTRAQAEPTRKQGNSLKITTDIGPLGWSVNFFTGKE